jgi:hypothetical protein
MRSAHETSWSANLEGPEHAADRDLVVPEAVAAVETTSAGTHVNIVTHGDPGIRSRIYIPVSRMSPTT